MTTTRITRWVPTGTRHINWREDGTWRIKPFWSKRVQMEPYEPPSPAISYRWTETGLSFTRYYLKLADRSFMFHTNISWSLCNSDYLRNSLAEDGFHLRWFDKIEDYGSSNGIRDVYITSTILEKLYASEST